MTVSTDPKTVRQRLVDAVRELGPVSCRLPGEEEGVGFEEGLRWLHRSLESGLEVDYRVVPDPSGEGGEVWLMHWDPAEPKPPWAEDWEDEEQ